MNFRPSFLLVCLLALSAGAHAQLTYLHCGTVIDCRSDAVQKQVTIIVENDRITEMRSGYAKAPAHARVIDLKNKTVLPGLTDMHVHVENESSRNSYADRFRMNEADVAFRSSLYARRTLLAGFTTVRDMGGSGVNVALRDAIRDGIIEGPRIFTAEKGIGTTGGHADPTNGVNRKLMGDPGPAEGVINGPEDARKAVRQRYKNGADCIKITATGGVLSVAKDGQGPQFTGEELTAIVETARDYNMHTAAHAHGAEGIRRAVLAGITTIEHGTLMTPEIMELMKERGTYYVPTISAGRFVAEKAKEPGYFPRIIVPKAMEIGAQIQETFGAAYRAGVRIAFGTDAGVSPHGDNGKEFIYMVEAGMPPMEAIRSATVTPATILGMSQDLGTLEAGKLADIIATDGNPLEDINHILKVVFVMKEGKVYKAE